MQDQAQRCVKHCIEIGSCSAVHSVAGGGAPHGGYILYSVWQEAAGFRLSVVIRSEPESCVGSWLGGFEWAIFVGVDAFA